MIGKILRRLTGSESGGALVELAVVLPMLLVIFAGVVDFARVFYTSISLTTAARAAAQYGSASRTNSFNVAEMQAMAGAAGMTGVTAVASRTCRCATDDGPAADFCTSPEEASCVGQHRVITVTVTASKTFTTFMDLLPGVSGSFQLSRSATMRVVE
jgi:Flp pilus assembly protein TadG